MECIFCKIVNNEIPCYKVYETDKVIAFLDINPVSIGHTVIITKKHYKNIIDAPIEEINEIMKAIKQIIHKYTKILNTNNFNIINNSGKIAGQEVEHIHFHIIPRYENDTTEVKTKKGNTEELEKTYKKIKSINN